MNKEVTDPKSIHKLIDSLYRVTPVYLEVDGEDIPIKVLDSNPNAITIPVPQLIFMLLCLNFKIIGS